MRSPTDDGHHDSHSSPLHRDSVEATTDNTEHTSNPIAGAAIGLVISAVLWTLIWIVVAVLH